MTDFYTMVGIESVLVALVIVGLVKTRSKELGICVKRGIKSRRRFGVAYGFGSVILLQVVNSSESFAGHKVLLSLVNITMLFYLCFLSGWFRNKIIGWIGKWEEAWER